MATQQAISPISYSKLDALARRHVACAVCGAGKGDRCSDLTPTGSSARNESVHPGRIDIFVAALPHLAEISAERSLEVDELKVEQRRRERQIRLLRSRMRDEGRAG